MATVITQTVDLETGELVGLEKEHTFYLPKEKPFVKLYLEDVSALHDLPRKSANLMFQLLMKMDYNSIITLNSASKKRIAETLGTTVPTIDNQLAKLVKANIIQRSGRGEYMFNPDLFAKGEWKNMRNLIDKYLELKITYSSEGTRSIVGSMKEAV